MQDTSDFFSDDFYRASDIQDLARRVLDVLIPGSMEGIELEKELKEIAQ